MNEKVFCVFACVWLLLFSCRTTGVYDNRAGAGAVRNNIGELGEKQTAAAITGAELKSEIERSLDEIGNLEQTIECGAGDFEEFKAIIQRIRARGANNAHGKPGAD